MYKKSYNRLKSGAFYERQRNAANLNTRFFEVVRQHILVMVDNVIYYFVENLTGFPAVKEF